ncbi:hypothetical protein BDW74DRAFT_156202 [Aspergillus multicolor]|uniref:uncharacterized protein n=1 Tax=Aspergillus multicolor TaxID=41759 RepID=UPI003CCD2C8E
MAVIHFSYLFLLSLLTTLTASQKTSTTVEVDQIFPRNETYAPTRYFPIIWGLQNATTAYPYAFTLYWRLRLADSAVFVLEGDGRFPESDNLDETYSSGAAPTDPIVFHDFPLKMRNFTTGHWELQWRFGFEYNCSLSDPGFPDEHSSKQPWNNVTFSIAEGGKSVELLDNRECESEADGRAVAFGVSPPHPREPDQDCPVVNDTRPNPCALDFTAEAVENITAAAREIGRCPEFEGGLADFPVTCRNHGMRVGFEWTRVVGAISILWALISL